MMKPKVSQEFHIETLIQLVKTQAPNRIDLITALEKVEIKKWKKKAYTHFVDATNPNQPYSKWQFKESIVLEDEGTIILDILKDGSIGGVEFYELL